MMDDATKDAYLRAAVALERHDQFPGDHPDKVVSIAMRAYDKCNTAPNEVSAEHVYAVDIEAARLLRECVAKSEPLP